MIVGRQDHSRLEESVQRECIDGCELRLTYFNLSRSKLDVIDGFAGKTFEGA